MKDLKNATVHLKIALGSNMNVSSLTPLAITEIMEDYHQAQLKLLGTDLEWSLYTQVVNLKEKNKKLEFMIENGLDWEDMKNDISMPHEL